MQNFQKKWGLIVFDIVVLVFSFVLMIFLVKSLSSFAFSSVGGMSVSCSGDRIKIKGKVASLTINGKLVFGSLDAENTNSNSISQSDENYTLHSVCGHVKVNCNSNLKVLLNNKSLS